MLYAKSLLLFTEFPISPLHAAFISFTLQIVDGTLHLVKVLALLRILVDEAFHSVNNVFFVDF
jgi:uncharacterized protein Usg